MVYQKNKALDVVNNFKAGWGQTFVEEKPDIRDVAHTTNMMLGDPDPITKPLVYDKAEKKKLILKGFYISVGVALLLVLAVKFKLVKL